MSEIRYGLGGYDPAKPNNNIVYEAIEDFNANTLTVKELGVVVQVRPLTQAEIAAHTLSVNTSAMSANPQAQIDALVAAIAALQAVADTPNATINANPAAAIKACARETMTVARRVVRLARLQLGALDSTDGAS